MIEMIELANNFKKLIIRESSFWFSYTTCVAFRKDGILYCSENIWSNTTGKHLNMICIDKKQRIDNVNFYVLLHEATK
jgi:hypothetical protein